MEGGSCTRGRRPSHLETRHTRRYPAHSHHKTKRHTPKERWLGGGDYAPNELNGLRRPVAEFATTPKAYRLPFLTNNRQNSSEISTFTTLFVGSRPTRDELKHTLPGRTDLLWRGSLLPLGRAAALKSATTFLQKHRIYWLSDCCAAERGQAPSPQDCVGQSPTFTKQTSPINTW
ncbi:hypothetical protein ACVK1X_000315 [Pseudomonas sp. PvR086]|jgi:hypothetical protein|nr:hypothetical protein [Pseudomonas frederiksbergensis]